MNTDGINKKVLAGDRVEGECHFCGKEVGGEFWCFGCHHFICGNCESPDAPTGQHKVKDHREDK